MMNSEVVRECKQAYELLLDIKENCDLLEDIEDTKNPYMLKQIANINETMDLLGYLYSKAWELMNNNKDEKEQLKTMARGAKCPKCGSELLISDFISYAYMCKECDENYYYTECELDNAWWEEFNEEESFIDKLKRIAKLDYNDFINLIDSDNNYFYDYKEEDNHIYIEVYYQDGIMGLREQDFVMSACYKYDEENDEYVYEGE